MPSGGPGALTRGLNVRRGPFAPSWSAANTTFAQRDPFLLSQVGIEKWHLDIPRAMSAKFGLTSISAEKLATKTGGPENERSFAKGPNEISCLSDSEIIGLVSKRASA
jgi:hypothetical protein